MGLDQFDIIFENASKCFYPGQLVRGAVVFASSSEETVEGLHIEWVGHAGVHWSEEHYRTRYNSRTRRYDTDYYTVNFDSSDNYFDGGYWPFGNGVDQQRVPPGRYEYPFEFLLPSDIPASFEGVDGWVRYEVSATLKNKWLKDYKAENGTFRVFAQVDLNRDPDAPRPSEGTDSKMMGCCSGMCCVSGPVGFVIRLPKTGYTPGELLKFDIQLQNFSQREVTLLALQLVQDSAFLAGGKTKMEYFVVTRMERGGMPPKSSDVWAGTLCTLPDLPPNDLGGCKIIHISYRLELVMSVTGCGENPKGAVNMKIGTIPLGFVPSHSPSVHHHAHHSSLKSPSRSIHPNTTDGKNYHKEVSSAKESEGEIKVKKAVKTAVKTKGGKKRHRREE